MGIEPDWNPHHRQVVMSRCRDGINCFFSKKSSECFQCGLAGWIWTLRQCMIQVGGREKVIKRVYPDIVFRTARKFCILSPFDQNTNGKVFAKVLPFVHDGGAEGIRTTPVYPAFWQPLKYIPNQGVLPRVILLFSFYKSSTKRYGKPPNTILRNNTI